MSFDVIRISDTHEWRLTRSRWELHFLTSQTPEEPLRVAHRFETEMLDATKRAVELRNGVIGVAVGLLRECLGPVELAAAMETAEGPDATEELIGHVKKFCADTGWTPPPADPPPDVQLGPVAITFLSHASWVNRAQSEFQHLQATNRNAAMKRYLCLDAAGRVCMIGKDFARARDEGKFPVRVFLIDKE